MKLSKMQAQAIISKLGRKATDLRKTLIAEEKEKYVLSKEGKELSKLLEIRDEASNAVKEAEKAVKELAEKLGLSNVYSYTKKEEALERLRDKEIEKLHPAVDIDEALDDLIIRSIEDGFNVDTFIEQYLNKVRNG